MNDGTPTALAMSLAYLSDPSAIHAYVKSHFGKAPSMAKCREIRARYVAANKPRSDPNKVDAYKLKWACKHDKTEANIEVTENGNQTCKACGAAKERKAKDRVTERAARLKARQDLIEEGRARRRSLIELGIETRDTSRLAVAEIIGLAAVVFETSPDEITSYSRLPHVIRARDAASMVAYERKHSYPSIGRVMLRDHSTVILAVARARNRSCPEFIAKVEQVRKALKW